MRPFGEDFGGDGEADERVAESGVMPNGHAGLLSLTRRRVDLMGSRHTRCFASWGRGALLALSLCASAPARADDSITPPQPISALHATYPERASGSHDVHLELLIAADGSVEHARVVEGQAPFTDPALEAAEGLPWDADRAEPSAGMEQR